MAKQYCLVVPEEMVANINAVLPRLQMVEVVGLPVKDAGGNEFMALVTQMPPKPVEPGWSELAKQETEVTEPVTPAQPELPLGDLAIEPVVEALTT
jgi:hypothetical protein